MRDRKAHRKNQGGERHYRRSDGRLRYPAEQGNAGEHTASLWQRRGRSDKEDHKLQLANLRENLQHSKIPRTDFDDEFNLSGRKAKKNSSGKGRMVYDGGFLGFRRFPQNEEDGFQSMVQGAALSGLEAFAGHRGQLTQKDVAPIDVIILRYGRVLLQGKAVTDQGGKKKAKKTEAVWKMLRLVPSLIELRIRRLKWLQSVAGKLKRTISY